MDYSIGEVSALLNVSRDMIRYYEKQGAIHSSRKAGNNYRTYDDMEVFWLLEALQHRSWGITINEISEIRNHSYASNTERFLREEARRLEEESVYRKMYAVRLEEIADQMLLGMRNIGNGWVEKILAEYRCHLVTGRGDAYDRINIPQEASGYIFSEKCLPFFDSALTVRAEGDQTVESRYPEAHEKTTAVEWEMCIPKKYADALGFSVPEPFYEIPEMLCFCTNVDIGEIGDFRTEELFCVKQLAVSHGNKLPEGYRIRGKLLGRGYEGGRFRRIVKLYVPIL